MNWEKRFITFLEIPNQRAKFKKNCNFRVRLFMGDYTMNPTRDELLTSYLQLKIESSVIVNK